MSRQEYEDVRAKNNNFDSADDRRKGLENNLVAIGLFGIQDPLRDTIVKSVE
jgi:magnesium-transporting ATPase (P-type)